MRWRCSAGSFQRTAVLSARTSRLVHLTIRPPKSDGHRESHRQRQASAPDYRKLLDSISSGSGIIVLGSVWLWQSGVAWLWSITTALVGLLAWPLVRIVRRRAQDKARRAPADLAEPSTGWTSIERDAWFAVIQSADRATPLGFTEFEALVARARETVEVVAQCFHPGGHDAWAQFTLPEFLLLTERLCRDIRREALRHIPAVGTIRFSHLLWAHQQNRRYGVLARTGWRIGFGIWRVVRTALNPLQAVGQETSGAFVQNAVSVLSYRMRAYATRLLVLEVGRAAIDLYAGRLMLSPHELQAA